jgi:hypothetical protein
VRRAANKNNNENEAKRPGTAGPPLDRLTKTPKRRDSIEPGAKKAKPDDEEEEDEEEEGDEEEDEEGDGDEEVGEGDD